MLFVLSFVAGCKKWGLLDYRDKYVGDYKCLKACITCALILDMSDTTWKNVCDTTLPEPTTVNISKVEVSVDEILILGKERKINKDGTGKDWFNYDSYEIEIKDNVLYYTTGSSGHTFSSDCHYDGIKK